MGEQAQRIYDFGPFRLDSDQRILLRDGVLVPLPPKAFDLLLALVRESGRVLDKRHLMRAVWPDVFVEEANLTLNIHILRKALGEDAAGRSYIETVPRRGYRFSNDIACRPEAPHPAFRRLTFRCGPVQAARFAPDAGTVVYSAARDAGAFQLFAIRPPDPESHPLGFAGDGLLAVSRSGDLALALGRRSLRGYVSAGILARAPARGGPPVALLDDVQEADFSPDGERLAVVREVRGRSRLEFPAGTVLYETEGWVSHVRFDPAGERIAFLDHPIPSDDSGAVAVVDLSGGVRRLSDGWVSAQGLAWARDGGEIWFTASRSGSARALHAVSLAGDERLVQCVAGSVTLHDAARDGRVLLTRDNVQIGVAARAPGEAGERDLSWHDWSLVRDLSADGRLLLFTEAGEGGGASYGVYLRRLDGSEAVRLGDGSALALSPDGRWALARAGAAQPQLVLLPTGSGEAVRLERADLVYQQWASWFPDGERIVFAAAEAGAGTGLYVQAVAGGGPRAITDLEGIHLSSPNAVSPDGTLVAAVGPDGRPCLYPAGGGEPRPVAGALQGERPLRWGRNGDELYVREAGDLPARVARVDLRTGRREPWRELMPPDRAGVYEILRIVLTEDGEAYAYSYTRELSDLYLVEGVR